MAAEDFKSEVNLSSVNSINWARVMTQVVHYFYGYLRSVKEVGNLVNFSVPCGAFGNMCAGYIAKKMGLPVHKFIVSNNKNDVLRWAFEHGELEKRDLIDTPASAIDIVVPMNFWRFLYFALNEDPLTIKSLFEEYQTNGKVKFSEKQHSQFNKDFLFHTVENKDIIDIICEVYDSENYLLDPHGAVAVQGAKANVDDLGEHPTLCLATAHPAKFPMVIKKAIGHIPEAAKHYSIEQNREKCERILRCNFSSWENSLPEVMRTSI